MQITVAQINPVVGAVADNTDRVLAVIDAAAGSGAHLVVFSELILTGYPPKDLLDRPAFIDQAEAALDRIVQASRHYRGVGVILGAPRRARETAERGLYNSALLIADGAIQFEQAKSLLPTYDVFDEARYFRPARRRAVCTFDEVRLGLSICEDLWFEPDPWSGRPYACDPIQDLASIGVDLLINISASPFAVGKEKVRYELIRNHCRRHRVPFLFVNQVGGNDDLVFDGRSLLVGADGEARFVWPSFQESIRTIDTASSAGDGPYAYESEVDTIYRALVLGTRDYVRKCGFERVVIGISGGIDSGVTAAVAADALGPDKVLGIAMPSPYSSPESLADAEALAAALGMELRVVPIEEAMRAYGSMLSPSFAGTDPDETEENIQARIRGNIIMAFSNKFGHLPLSTGNKSELAVGYCTLYGDMSGGLAVISDVPKTWVYRLASHVNRNGERIPQRMITKAPSAELKPNQTDQDTLPPYEVLDAILERYIDGQLSLDAIVDEGFDPPVASWVIDAVRRNEYKRKQAAPGLKVTSKAFGTGRRMPIAARYDV